MRGKVARLFSSASERFQREQIGDPAVPESRQTFPNGAFEMRELIGRNPGERWNHESHAAKINRALTGLFPV